MQKNCSLRNCNAIWTYLAFLQTQLGRSKIATETVFNYTSMSPVLKSFIQRRLKGKSKDCRYALPNWKHSSFVVVVLLLLLMLIYVFLLLLLRLLFLFSFSTEDTRVGHWGQSFFSTLSCPVPIVQPLAMYSRTHPLSSDHLVTDIPRSRLPSIIFIAFLLLSSIFVRVTAEARYERKSIENRCFGRGWVSFGQIFT